MLQELRNLFASGRFAVHGLLLEEEGETLLALGDCDTRRPVYSAAKSFTATAAGMLEAEGKWSLDDPLLDYLPPGPVSRMEPASREAFAGLPIRRFLTMSVPGYPFRPEGEDWLSFCLSCPARYGGEPLFAYSNIPAYLAGVAAERAAGEPLAGYLARKLLAPLGIENPVFRTDPAGRFYGATGMELSVRELSRLGTLYLRGGVWEGERLLPASWVKAATAPQIPAGKQYYGYFFWVGTDNFSVSGKWGQKCIVYPAEKRVVTWEGDMPEDAGSFERIVREILRPAKPAAPGLANRAL